MPQNHEQGRLISGIFSKNHAMQINLTWDLFIVVFFLIILSYSFIIGKSNTVKLVLSSYISLLAADAIGNMLNKLLLNANPVIDIFSVSANSPSFVILKISIFVLFMVILAVRGSFDITMPKEEQTIEFLSTFFFGALSAGLIISAILVFSSGSSFIMGGVPINESNIADMYNQSYLVKLMVLNYNVWFALPVVAFIVMSLIRHADHEE